VEHQAESARRGSRPAKRAIAEVGMGLLRRVIGVDPGSAVCGFGVVERGSHGLRYLAAGTIRTIAAHGKPLRLKAIHQRLLDVIDEHAPDAMSLERSFVASNVQSAFRLGEARAMAILAAADRNLKLFEYAPNEVKLSVAAYGHADKRQVNFMVRQALSIDPALELADDATDALALALCHLTRSRIALASQRLAGRSRRAVRIDAGAVSR
jgi:crossover junction endodeoxyribonuclease RuvC